MVTHHFAIFGAIKVLMGKGKKYRSRYNYLHANTNVPQSYILQ